MDHILTGSGLVAGPFFVLVFMLEGMFRPGYQPLRQPVSSLAMGPRGWIQRANFFITGALVLGYAVQLRTAVTTYGVSFWAPRFIGIYGLGLIGSGVFNTDVTGLPTNKPHGEGRTRDGILHDLFAVPVIVGLLGACAVFGSLFYREHETNWTWYSAASGTLFLFLFISASAGFAGHPKFARMAGLVQRSAIVIGWSWLTLSAAHLRTIIR